jgi:hypothetical protein
MSCTCEKLIGRCRTLDITYNVKKVVIDHHCDRLLVLICILRQESFEKHGLIDYNFQCFKEAITDVFEFSNTRNKLNSQLADGSSLVDNTSE